MQQIAEWLKEACTIRAARFPRTELMSRFFPI